MSAGRVAFAALFALLLLLCFSLLSAKTATKGITIDLIHRDSLNPHVSNPNDNHQYAHVKSAITRSMARANQISTLRHRLKLNAASDYETVPKPITSSGQYIMNVFIGTPPVPFLGLMTTGTNFIWTQCKPCELCYEQHAPVFEPHKSCTFKRARCSADICNNHAVGFTAGCGSNNTCQYRMEYDDLVSESTSSGVMASETFTIGSLKFSNLFFGCGVVNDVSNYITDTRASGVIGLGNGPDSLNIQLSKAIGGGGEFSYCLLPHNYKGSKSSKLSFGQNAVVSGQGVVSTPLVRNYSSNLWVNIKAITIGKVRISFPYNIYLDNGDALVDTSSSFLILPREFFDSIVRALNKQVNAKKIETDYHRYACYESKSFKAPTIVLNLDGADVKLNDFNAFVKVKDDVICFAAMRGLSELEPVIGSYAQMNFLVGFDMVSRRVSFKPVDCSAI